MKLLFISCSYMCLDVPVSCCCEVFCWPPAALLALIKKEALAFPPQSDDAHAPVGASPVFLFLLLVPPGNQTGGRLIDSGVSFLCVWMCEYSGVSFCQPPFSLKLRVELVLFHLGSAPLITVVKSQGDQLGER
jgi:hypothetical protein